MCLTKHHAMKTHPLLNWAPHHEDVLRNGGIAPRSLNFGTICRWVVSFVPRPLYPRGNSPQYPLDRRLDGPQSRSGRGSSRDVIRTTVAHACRRRRLKWVFGAWGYNWGTQSPIGGVRKVYNILVGMSERKGSLGRSVDGRIILKWNINK
jgi:hypothetical protein